MNSRRLGPWQYDRQHQFKKFPRQPGICGGALHCGGQYIQWKRENVSNPLAENF